MNAAPMRIGSFRLKVCDLEGTFGFYRKVLGLKVMETETGQVTLGTGSQAHLTLEDDPSHAPRDVRQPGLFDSAILLPSRAALARVFLHMSYQLFPRLCSSH